ncbi:hypothetical protein [Hymenobacter jeollabukensis]|uniref:DUF4890 domain-containing protein n=1 Tax=Hymenobacter jeollabukensis TaxID=2025313 RepID=A0A5R8WIN6_9BACT|nr:hypothetical protein [Hymenobacter jeollabukensis]TLM88357.1 hypothetical protein FDY95_24570 [Hymenobacter jeollabukensis]
MKKQLFSLALILGLAGSFAGNSFAADFGKGKDKDRRELRQDGRKDGDKDHKKGRRDDAQHQQQRLDRMAKELDLSKKQQEKVAKIFQDQQQQMQALRGQQQASADRSQRMAQAKQIHERTDKQLKDVLNKKQYAQFEAKRQERMKQMQQRRGQHDGRRGDFKQGRS